MARNRDLKKVDFQLDPEVYEVLKEVAQREDRSVASLMRVLVAERLRGETGDTEKEDNGKQNNAANDA